MFCNTTGSRFFASRMDPCVVGRAIACIVFTAASPAFAIDSSPLVDAERANLIAIATALSSELPLLEADILAILASDLPELSFDQSSLILVKAPSATEAGQECSFSIDASLKTDGEPVHVTSETALPPRTRLTLIATFDRKGSAPDWYREANHGWKLREVEMQE